MIQADETTQKRRCLPQRIGLRALWVALLLAAPFTAACGESLEPVPPELLGVWRAQDPPYEGRTLTIGESTISFSQGGDAFEEFPIEGAEIREEGSSLLYVVRYRNADQVQSISLLYEWGSEPAVRLKNRADIRWRREPASG